MEVGGEAMGDREVMEAFRERWDWFALISHVEIQTLFEGIPAISAMSPDKRMLVPQEEISGEEAMVERGHRDSRGRGRDRGSYGGERSDYDGDREDSSRGDRSGGYGDQGSDGGD